MQVLFKTRDPRGADYRELAVHRVRFALRRLNWLVPRATVELSDLNGPRSGVDKRCRVAFTAPGAGTVVVTAVAKDWRSALDEALSRATRALLRLWRRSRGPRRLPAPIAAP